MLTDKQRRLAEENHNLIYGYAAKEHLDIDEYYGILAIGLCKAAQAYNKKKGMFSTFAYACMKNEVLMHWRATTKKSSIPLNAIVSYDEKGEEKLFEEFPNYPYQNMEEHGILLDVLRESLTGAEQHVLELMLAGETQEKISKIRGCKQQNICYNIKQIRKKAKQALNY